MVGRAFREELTQLIRARSPILYVESYEEQRVLAEVVNIAHDPVVMDSPCGVWTWSATTGLVRPDGTRRGGLRPEDALGEARRIEQPALLVFKDLHPLLGGPDRPAEPEVVRLLRDIAAVFRASRTPRAVILVSPVAHIPPELVKDVTLLDFPLP
ncbi:MAG TPA: ATPase, partial [Pilimelia sp.]|nr:ATPase [Pilimelia sp.]